MRLLAVEASQNGSYSRSRYIQVEELGAELYVLNGLGNSGFWPAQRYRIVGSKKIGDLVEAAAHWQASVSQRAASQNGASQNAASQSAASQNAASQNGAGFDGVLTFAESAIIATAAVAEALGLPGIGLPAARASRNKIFMHEAHERAGAPHARFRYAPSLADGLTAAADFGYPVVVKPALGAASNFVFRADTAVDFSRCYTAASIGAPSMTWTQMEADDVDLGPDGLLVESFLDGSEHLIEAFAWDGEVRIGAIVDRVTSDLDTFEDNTHQAPTRLSQEQIAQVHAALTAAAAGQGLRRSALHAEVRFHRGLPYVLEVTPRPGGGGLEHMARASAAYQPILSHVQISCGRRPPLGDYTPTGVCTATRALLCPAGRITELSVPAEVRRSADLLFCRLVVAPGDVIKRPPDGNGILGFLGATGSSHEDAMQNATRLAEQITVTVSG